MGTGTKDGGAPDERGRAGGDPSRVAGTKGGSASEEGGDRAGVIPDLFRKMMTLGLSGLFSTEAALRGALGDSVPREWVDFVAEQSERTRAEFTQRLAEEFGRMLESVDVAELAEELLAGRSIEVKAEIRLGPRETAAVEGAGTSGKKN